MESTKFDGAFDPASTGASVSSLDVLHPIHLSIGVSRSASIELLSSAGAEKASFTPSKRPIFKLVEGVRHCCLLRKANPSADARIERERIREDVLNFILKM